MVEVCPMRTVGGGAFTAWEFERASDENLHPQVSAHHRHGVRGADEGGWSKISPS
jgi:hypothetical protein